MQQTINNHQNEPQNCGSYLSLIENYIPYNEQEKADQKAMLSFIENHPHHLTRDELSGHMTVSLWTVNEDYTKTLMVYHHIYDSWAWIGGHVDGDDNFIHVCLKELEEETGTHALYIDPNPISLEILTVDGHVKRGEYVSSHLHYNLTFLAVVNEHEFLRIAPEENSGVKWFTFEDALKASSEPWFVENVYKKLIKKVQIKRIKQMESYFDLLLDHLGTDEMYEQLETYFHSDLWKLDFEADEKGLLPSDLKRGVLSEDGLYNYFSQNKKGVK